MTDFLAQKCQARTSAMSEDAIRSHLAQMSGWREAGGAIEKRFAFKGWLETVAFVDALAWMCHVEDHHPDLVVRFDHCVVRFSIAPPASRQPLIWARWSRTAASLIALLRAWHFWARKSVMA